MTNFDVSNILFCEETTLNNILITQKFFQSKYLSDRLITSAQNVVPVHARTPSVAVSTGWQPSQWQSAADHPTSLQRGAASARRRYLNDIYIHTAAWLPELEVDGVQISTTWRPWSPVSPAAAARWCRGRDVPERCLVERQTCRLQHVWLLEASAETARHRGNTGRSPSPQGQFKNISSVIPTCDTATDTITDLLNVEREQRCAGIAFNIPIPIPPSHSQLFDSFPFP